MVVETHLGGYLRKNGISRFRLKSYHDFLDKYRAVYSKTMPDLRERADADTCFWTYDEKEDILYISCPHCCRIQVGGALKEMDIHKTKSPHEEGDIYINGDCDLCECENHNWWVFEDWQKIMGEGKT